MEDCIFCKIIAGEIPAKVIDENEQVIVILSLQNHPLIITKKHIPTVYELSDSEGSAVMTEAIKIANAVKKGLRADGVNLIQNNEAAAGQEVHHFHMHVRPRWKRDEMKISFPAEVVDQDLQKTTLERIKEAL